MKKSDERYRLFFENVPTGIIHYNREGVITNVNKAIVATFGSSREKLIGLSLSAIPNKKFARGVYKSLQGERGHYDGRYVSDGGNREAYVKVDWIPIFDAGKVVAGVGIVEDYSARQRAEDALQESEERYGNIFKDSSSVMLLLDPENGTIADANSAATHFYGWSLEEMRTKKISDINILTEKQVLREMQLAKSEKRRHFYFQHRLASGEIRDVEVYSDPFTFHGQEMLFSIIHDITDRKRTEKALLDSEANLAKAQQIAHIGNWSFDLQSDILVWSDELYRIFGLSPQNRDVKYQTYLQYIHPDDLEDYKKFKVKVLREKNSYALEYRIIRRDNDVRFIYEQGDVTVDRSGNPIKLFGLVRDITERKVSEAAVRESEEKFRGLVESSCDWVWEVDRNGVYTYASPQVEKILGYTPEEVVGRSVFDFMMPEEKRKMDPLFKEFLKKEMPIVVLENSAQHKDGERVILETSGVPFCDEKGRICGYRGIDRDITERKKIEEEKEKIQEAVLEGRNMWENTFDTIPLMISILNEKHEIVRVNRAMADAVGTSIGDLIHTPCYVTVHGTDAPPDYCPHTKLLADRKEHAVEMFEPLLDAHLSVTVAPLYDGKNQFMGSVHIARDISQQKKQEKKLKKFNEQLQDMVDDQTREIRERENLLAAIFRAAPAGIGVMTDGVISYVNPMLKKITGHSNQDLIGQSICILYPGNSSDKAKHDIINGFQRATSTVETKWLRKDGSIIDVLLSSTPINSGSHCTETTFLALDITPRKIAEREVDSVQKKLLHAEKLFAVGRFSASIAHEFNNPLQGVLNVIRGVQERATLSKRDRELVGLAMKECLRMKGLIQNLQQFNRPTSGIRKELNIHQIIDEVLLFTKKEFSSKKIAVIKNYAEHLQDIWAVPDQIKQVFVNIIGNACDAISGDGGNIVISTASLDGERICIGIKDSGEGIGAEDIGDIFEPFFTTKAVTGTGLGLSTSYGIIKSHGGDIDVESELGLGTLFSITLPRGMRE